ncbi:MAG: DUF4959 domain-containing protein [Prevotellaceae bacterium]|jgi:hypothetical protein|nr:DUF4959 domain-containing protein [Prevotellaceae bacterium]
MRTIKYIFLFVMFLQCLFACKEERFEINSNDRVPPGQPADIRYKPLNGGVRLFYKTPADEDLLSIDAVYMKDDKPITFSVSYFRDSLDVHGFADTIDYEIQLYAVDRAGNRSEPVDLTVRPLESVISKVKKTLIARPGFSAIFVDWTNELAETVNIFVDYSFTQDGTERELMSVFASSDTTNRVFINDLDPANPVKVKIRVSDLYDNMSETVDFGSLSLLTDVEVPKFDDRKNPLWSMPIENTYPPFGGGVKQVMGNTFDGITSKVIDGIIDRDGNLNYLFSDTAAPWSVMIDLGDYYELSRILTHQRHSDTGAQIERGSYYRNGNIGIYNFYRWDEQSLQWEFITRHKIPVPTGTLSDLEWMRIGRAGDLAYMFPDNPGFTKPTRWVRLEAWMTFDENYTSTGAVCLSEITLFAKNK